MKQFNGLFRLPYFAALLLFASFVSIPSTLLGQQKPLTNADVINMVKNGLPESVVVSAIKSQPANYDTSPDGLIALHKAGVTSGEMDAIMGAGKAAAAGAPAATNQEALGAMMADTWQMPTVAVIENDAPKPLTMEKSQLAQTKTKPSSLNALASDTVMAQAFQAGVQTAAMGAAMHSGSVLAVSPMYQAGSMMTNMMGHRKPQVTYVWGVPGTTSKTVVNDFTPTFTVNFSHAPGVTPDDYEPAIVKLTPAQNTCRIVGATQGKEDQQSSAAADWQVYSSFLEERVPVTLSKNKPGDYKVVPASKLVPGEYAVVLRPVNKAKKFAGGDVMRSQGDGLAFNAVWSFQTPTVQQ